MSDLLMPTRYAHSVYAEHGELVVYDYDDDEIHWFVDWRGILAANGVAKSKEEAFNAAGIAMVITAMKEVWNAAAKKR